MPTEDAEGFAGSPEEELGTLLQATAPPEPTAREGTLLAVARGVVEADRGLRGRLRRTRRHRRVAAATAAVAVLVPSGAWAAQHFLAQTGAFGDPGRNPGLQDGSELIDTCAADLAAYTASVAPTDLPVPPGHSWAGYADAVAASSTDPGSCDTGRVGTTQATSLRLDLLARASADWGCVLVWADRDRDSTTGAGARSAMRAIDARAHALSPVDGSTGTWDPDTFLANSRLPQFVGCAR